MKKVGKTTRPFRYDLNQNPYDYTVEVRNRFKELDLIDSARLTIDRERFVTLYRRQVSRPSPRKRNAEKTYWLSEEVLQIAVKRGEAKSKGEKERYMHLNAEFQRRARRDKKAFLNDQCKEIEGNNSMGKTRDLFKKTRDTKGPFHAKMGTIKVRNCMDLTEPEDIKKWQEYTEKLYKKDLHSPENHNGVITHLESDILEYKVKCALGSITTNRVEVMEFQFSYFES